MSPGGIDRLATDRVTDRESVADHLRPEAEPIEPEAIGAVYCAQLIARDVDLHDAIARRQVKAATGNSNPGCKDGHFGILLMSGGAEALHTSPGAPADLSV